jgi:hypothetical protein
MGKAVWFESIRQKSENAINSVAKWEAIGECNKRMRQLARACEWPIELGILSRLDRGIDEPIQPIGG